ncbi:hypothetical protein FZC76_11135 [Sutcliffiella horikoshii]|uniref:Uncharacterized protein n=1 Tax=Sutcliffiella horikoshii TaxID=79883 RepID=A0A5D4T1Z6_9BACI|nr:hypothetical protein [Sutcliffiella horikoshii]TYS68284.1 hypothetical protein FZC76_11135 [Sutcliffiella horikoshii]
MYFVYFMENKNVVLSQYRKELPNVDEELKIKGRKGKVLSVNHVDDRHIKVHVALEKVVKKGFVDLSKKKKK